MERRKWSRWTFTPGVNPEALVRVKGGDLIQPMKFHPLSLKPMVLEMPQNEEPNQEDDAEKENEITSTECSVSFSPGEKIKEKFQSFQAKMSTSEEQDSIGDSVNVQGYDSNFHDGNLISVQNPVQNVRKKILQVRSKSS